MSNSLRIGPNGDLYGVNSLCVYRVDLQKDAVEMRVKADQPFTTAGPIVEKELFVGREHRLWAIRLFE